MKQLPIYIFSFFSLVILNESSVLAQQFAVIVNSENNYYASSDEIKTIISQMYLKKRPNWPNGMKSMPFTPNDHSTEQQAFNENILKMNQAQLTQYWTAVKQKTGDSPPKEVKSPKLMLIIVAKYPGAFGVVPVENISEDESGIRILYEFETSS